MYRFLNDESRHPFAARPGSMTKRFRSQHPWRARSWRARSCRAQFAAAGLTMMLAVLSLSAAAQETSSSAEPDVVGDPLAQPPAEPPAEEPERDDVRPDQTSQESPADAQTETPPLDAEPPEAEPLDAEPLDAEPLDAEPLDAEPPVAKAPITFLVTEVQVQGDVAIDPETARDLLANRFGRLHKQVEVRTLGDLKTSLDKASMMAMLGGDGADIGGLSSFLDVDRVVYGRVARVGSIIDISVRMINVREATVELAMSRRLKADADPSLIVAVLDRQADKLLAWVIEAYTDGAESGELLALREKKKPTRAEVAAGSQVDANNEANDASAAEKTTEKDAAASTNEDAEADAGSADLTADDTNTSMRFTWLGLTGAALAGSGVGVIVLASAAAMVGGVVNVNPLGIPFLTEGTIALSGAIIAVVGVVILIADNYFFE